jgi:hypothetical protein
MKGKCIKLICVACSAFIGWGISQSLESQYHTTSHKMLNIEAIAEDEKDEAGGLSVKVSEVVETTTETPDYTSSGQLFYYVITTRNCIGSGPIACSPITTITTRYPQH